MELFMKEIGKVINIMDLEGYITALVIFMKAPLLKIWRKVLESTSIQMVANTLVTGKMISKMVLEVKSGAME